MALPDFSASSSGISASFVASLASSCASLLGYSFAASETGGSSTAFFAFLVAGPGTLAGFVFGSSGSFAISSTVFFAFLVAGPGTLTGFVFGSSGSFAISFSSDFFAASANFFSFNSANLRFFAISFSFTDISIFSPDPWRVGGRGLGSGVLDGTFASGEGVLAGNEASAAFFPGTKDGASALNSLLLSSSVVEGPNLKPPSGTDGTSLSPAPATAASSFFSTGFSEAFSAAAGGTGLVGLAFVTGAGAGAGTEGVLTCCLRAFSSSSIKVFSLTVSSRIFF